MSRKRLVQFLLVRRRGRTPVTEQLRRTFRQCEMLGMSWRSWYHMPVGEPAENLR